LLDRNGEFGTVETPGGNRLTAWLPPGVAAGHDVNVALRPENIRLGVKGTNELNHFTARVTGQRYQGTQTVYELATLGGQLEAVELGTSVRYPVGSDVEILLPPGLCWAYSARDAVPSE
jgi:iron(III) transport system ATP-binding protein